MESRWRGASEARLRGGGEKQWETMLMILMQSIHGMAGVENDGVGGQKVACRERLRAGQVLAVHFGMCRC